LDGEKKKKRRSRGGIGSVEHAPCVFFLDKKHAPCVGSLYSLAAAAIAKLGRTTGIVGTQKFI